MIEINDPLHIILVVDDSAFTRKRIRQVLQPDGYALVEAESGAKALTILGKQQFSCILTDLVMPELDGFGLLAEIQRRHMTTPVVVISADIQKTTRGKCEELGATGFVQKPINPEILRSLISGILGGRS